MTREGERGFSLAALFFNPRFFGSYFKGTFSTPLAIESTCLPRTRGLVGAESIVGGDIGLDRDDSQRLLFFSFSPMA